MMRWWHEEAETGGDFFSRTEVRIMILQCTYTLRRCV